MSGPTPAGCDGERPVVVYIAGSGRSGSTLLERILGAVPGMVNVGELVDTFRRVVVGDELCGCGETFSCCPFWSAVGDRAFGGWDADTVAEFRTLQRDVARQRHLWRIAVPRIGGRAFRAGVHRYGELYGRLYRAILAESGASAVVDASKGMAHALAMTRAGTIDLRVVHLVRDARGVAFSWAKSGVERPQGVAPGATLSTFDTELTAFRWTLLQAQIAVARRRFAGSSLVRYEDLVERPVEEVGRCLAEIGLPVDAAALAHIDGRAVTLPVSHGLSGNPSRFKTGALELRLDEQWRRDMSRWERAKVTAITLGPLARHGYLNPRRPAARTVEVAPGPTRRPDVTVVIPTRGRPALVRAAVRSVVEQDYEGRVHVVVVHDQEEPDRSLEGLAHGERTVCVTVNEGRPGLAAARNWGLREVTSELVASCDDDDVWLPQKLRLQVQRLMEHPQMLVVGGGIRLLMPGDRAVEWLGRTDEVTRDDLLRSRRKELHSSTLVMRRTAFDLAGGYDEQLPHSYAEDYEWLLRASRFGTVGVVREPLAEIDKTGQSWFRERGEVIAAALEHLLASHPELESTRRGHARILGQIAFAHATAGEPRSSVRYLLRSLRRWPVAPQAHLALLKLCTGADSQALLRYARVVRRGLA